MRVTFLLLLSLWLIFPLQAQQDLPQDYFASPLEIPLILSGTFAELRSNHFHSGLDIKTHQKTGLNVHASAEGYISRIKISRFGYGKALYIQHPNGYTTVYAHLKKFSPTIQAYIKKVQYAKEDYEVEVFPKANELAVQQNELIAFSGNSGGSGGPHLHFEIRDASARPMNALNFGFDIQDSSPPLIQGVFVYPQGENSHVNSNNNRQKLRVIPQGDGTYVTEDFNAYGTIGFGVSTVDRLDFAPNKNGVYQIKTSVNGNELMQVDFKKFSFSESRYINRFIDYAYYKNKRKRVQKLFQEENNPLSIITTYGEKGLVHVKDSLDYNYVIKVRDFKGNTSTIKIPITSKEVALDGILPKKIDTTAYYAKASQAVAFDEDGFDIYIPKNALYEDMYLDIKKDGEGIQVHYEEVPLHKNMTIGFDVSKYTPKDREQLYVARMTSWGAAYYVNTYKKNNRFSVSTKTFGKYALKQDSAGPVITPVNFRENRWMSNEQELVFKIEDKLTNIGDYRATINGKFILMEYDYKTDKLVYYFEDDIIQESENNLKLIVLDNVGNSTTFEGTFFRKN
ncbi:M23 family metallopeptidase [Mesonia sp. MT50]|uniref:M23 family metallopeptidase n=1 Tax=Mesonia profundi TaxID=3070998 RepID=A0ABU1A429_9FLAO|nr:M23 family metallopeptidase [Mesonia profundi]MDQ7918465.1 M23 family metallopeptidase [Mesonia profundi]